MSDDSKKTWAISADHPALPGHFPGRPIVPGALALQCILDAAAARFPGIAIRGVRRIRFMRMIAPDERFSVEFEPPGASGVRFRVQTEAGAAIDGQLASGPAD
jgi:3-hydroxymyristoyl/3-hydroxydecanoyl-(acyl carrier protein) dehydratase